MSRATERRRSPAEWLQFGVAGVIVLVMFYPAIWMVYSSFKSNREIFRSPFALPAEWRWENLIEAWRVGGLGTLYLNSVFVTLVEGPGRVIAQSWNAGSDLSRSLNGSTPFRRSSGIYLQMTVASSGGSSSFRT